MDENQQLHEEEHVQEEHVGEQNLEEQQNYFAPLGEEVIQREKAAVKNRLANSFQMAKNRRLNVKTVKKDSVIKSVTRVTAKHILKDDETVTENIHYYGSSEKLEEKRKENAEMLHAGRFVTKDLKAEYRRGTDIGVKAAVGYRSFQQLSQFFPAFMQDGVNKDAFNEMVSKYGKQTDAPERFEVMDKLTEKIMGINPSDFDFSSDSAIAQKASSFDSMHTMVEAYRELIEDNPHYVQLLKNTKNDDEADSYFDKVSKQMEKLTAMSDYYRIRRMIMSDPEYIATGGDVEQEIKETDTKGTRHFKELLRTSYHLASNLNRVLGANDIDVPVPLEGQNELSKTVYGKLDEAVKINKNEYREAGNHATEYALRRENIIRDELDRLEREQDKKADPQMRNCLGKITDISRTVKVFDEKKGKYVEKKVKHSTPFIGGYGCITPGFLESQTFHDGYIQNRDVRPGLQERLKAIAQKMCNNSLSHDAHYPSKKYPELARKVEAMDNIVRMVQKLMLELNDDISDSEIVEFVETLLVSNSKDFFNRHAADEKRAKGQQLSPEEQNLAPIGEDEFSYYEDAYTEATMRSFYRHNALFEQVEQSLGAKALLLHPVDLAIKYPEVVQRLVNTNITITNIIKDNAKQPLMSFINKYNQNHTKRNKYKLDAQKFVDCADLYGSITFKLTFFTHVKSYIANLYLKACGNDMIIDEYSSISEERFNEIKSQVGDLGITREKVDQCYEAHKNDDIIKRMGKITSLNNDSFSKDVLLRVGAYLYYHPEIMTEKLLNHLTPEQGANVLNTTPQQAFRHAFRNGYVRDFTKEDLDAYAADMKKRGLKPLNYDPVTGQVVKADPYGLQVYYEMLEEEEQRK